MDTIEKGGYQHCVIVGMLVVVLRIRKQHAITRQNYEHGNPSCILDGIIRQCASCMEMAGIGWDCIDIRRRFSLPRLSHWFSKCTANRLYDIRAACISHACTYIRDVIYLGVAKKSMMN